MLMVVVAAAMVVVVVVPFSRVEVVEVGGCVVVCGVSELATLTLSDWVVYMVRHSLGSTG